MGRADYVELGDWNAACWECGRKFKASTLKRHWQGFYVCPDHWEPRQPQDFVRGMADDQIPPWTQDVPDTFVLFCLPNGRSSTAGLSVGGCWIAGFTDPAFDANGD